MERKWVSIKSFFCDLNNACEYVVLRNWESLDYEIPYMHGHDDIDILCSNISDFIQFSGARRIHKMKSRDNYLVDISNSCVRFDVRHIGDGYYDAQWQSDILKNRYKDGYYYRVNDEMFPMILCYHSLIQKKHLSGEYYNLLCEILHVKSDDGTVFINKLKQYLDAHKYQVTIPNDPGVYFNKHVAKKIGKNMSGLSMAKRLLFRIQSRLNITY